MWEIWAKLIVAKGFKKLLKVQQIAKSGHTANGLKKARNLKSRSCVEIL